MASHDSALLVAVDDSESSDHAFAFAAKYADRLGAQLHLVHVVRRQLNLSSAEYDAVLAKAEDMVSRRFISKLPAAERPQPIIHIIKAELDTDSIGQILVKKAQVEKAIALVIASHNKGKIKEMLTGSVTKYVVANLRTPVVVVPVAGA